MKDCPRNFPGSHRPPVLDDVLTISFRESDNFDDVGAAMIDANGLFCGWVQQRGRNDIFECLGDGVKV